MNMDIFDNINQNERIKLILAYVVIPILTFGVEYIKGRLNALTLPFILMSISYVCIPPTIIRFVVKTQGIEYLSEIFAYTLLSILITYGTFYIIYSILSIPYFMDVLSIYLILSYKSKRKKSSFKVLNYPLWFAGALFGSIRYNIRYNIKNGQTVLDALTSSIISALIVFSFLLLFRSNQSNEQPETEQKVTTTKNDYDTNTQTFTKEKIYINLNPPQPPHNEPYQEPEQPQPPRAEAPDIADTLIDIGLAHIGRVTARDNPYLTPEKTAERRNVERPFIKALYERYPDEQTRKAISRHFMLYKEFTLFVIFSLVLKKDKPLHSKIRSRLKVRLSQGLPSKVIAKRNEYWRKLSEKFFDSYKQAKDIAGTLDYAFWSVLPESIKGNGCAVLVKNVYLIRIFEYTKDVIAKEYKKCVSI